jgi:hypothetical protein
MASDYAFVMSRIREHGTRRCNALLGVTLTAVVLIPGFAGAQSADVPAALPAVIYPDHVPNTVPSAPPPMILPPVTDSGGQIIYQEVDGVWGYWDRDRHFHRRPNGVVRTNRVERPVVRSVARPHPVETIHHAEGHRG